MGPFARTMDLGERKNPSSTSTLRESQLDVEDFDEPRTKLEGFFNTRYSAMMLEPGDFILKI